MKHPQFLERIGSAFTSSSGVWTTVRLLLVFGAGFGVHWLFFAGAGPNVSGEVDPHAGHDHARAEWWTCSMHPQIRKPGPGKCPICAMDLIPVDGGGAATQSLRELSLTPASKALMDIRTSPVERRYVEAEVRMVGKVEYDETRRRFITAWVPGRLDRLYVDYTGVEVREDDHMVYIYSPELYAAQQELIEALRSSRDRPRSPLLEGTGIDLVESAREKLRLWGMTKQQIAEIEQRDKPSDHMTIYAPMGGVVVEKLKQEGDYVQTGDRIYSIADLSQVWVKLDAYESDLPWLRYGQEVAFSTEAYPGETFVGRIAFIDPILNERTRTVKVRVNVANPEGKLKPAMFVSGIVRARVAGAGRVVDQDLVGKWISPMHPEIVKDEPGKCDICGMPLVRAETLGYVSERTLDDRRPLVVPASAVLLTGTRAIVYVELPDRDEPTYIGREIVLGPRAGAFYEVRRGLEEGERVVTRGNFKIDSALQIRAKPSMMTPEGGGGGGHQHGGHGGGASNRADDESTSDGMAMPPAFRAQLAALEAAFEMLGRAIESENTNRIRAAFRVFGEAVREVDVELVSGHAAMLWKEFGMLLGNDAMEGGEIERLPAAKGLYANTRRTMERVRRQLMTGHEGHGPTRLQTPEGFQRSIARVWAAYSKFQLALADDEPDAAKQAIASLEEAVDAIEDRGLPAEAARVWARELANLRRILVALREDDSLKGFRANFSLLSGEMEALVHAFGVGRAGPVYQVHCPMAFGNRGATWLQGSREIRNPYYGGSMLKCHDRIRKIASGGTSDSNGGATDE